MISPYFLPLVTLLLSLATAACAGALAAADVPARLGAHHRFAKRSASLQPSRRQLGGRGGPGGGNQRGGGFGGRVGGSSNKPNGGGRSSAAATKSPAAAKTTTSSKAAATTSSSSSSSSSTYSGKATYFYQEGGSGACGTIHKDSAKIVALQSELYASSYCGKSLTVTNTANGKSVTATVADECPGCSSEYSLDLSTGAFDEIGDEGTGVLAITWSWD